MAELRYNYVAKELWPWLGPALQGIDAEFRAIETGGGSGGGGEPTVADLTTIYNTAKA